MCVCVWGGGGGGGGGVGGVCLRLIGSVALAAQGSVCRGICDRVPGKAVCLSQPDSTRSEDL